MKYRRILNVCAFLLLLIVLGYAVFTGCQIEEPVLGSDEGYEESIDEE